MITHQKARTVRIVRDTTFIESWEERVSACLQGHKITVEQDRQCPPVESLRLICKLRWIGMEEEAEQLQIKIHEATSTGGVMTVARETD